MKFISPTILFSSLYFLVGLILTFFYLLLPTKTSMQPYTENLSDFSTVLKTVFGGASEGGGELANWVQYTAYMAIITLLFFAALCLTKQINIYQWLLLSFSSLLFIFITLFVLSSVISGILSTYLFTCITFF